MRKLKRIVALALTLCFAIQLCVFAESELNVDDSPTITQDSVKITGTADPNQRLSIVISTSSNSADITKYIIMQETRTDAEGEFEFVIDFPETLKDGSSTDEETFHYFIGTRNRIDVAAFADSFVYSAPISLEDAIVMIDSSTTKENLKTLITTSRISNVLKANGIKIDIYNSLLDTTENPDKDWIIEYIFNNKINTVTNFNNVTVPTVNEKILCRILKQKSATDIKTALETSDYSVVLPSGDNYSEFTSTIKDFCCGNLVGKSFDTYETLYKAIDDAYLTHKIQNTTYQSMHDVITQYKTCLNIQNDTYGTLNGLSVSNRNKVYKNFKTKFINDNCTSSNTQSILVWALANTSLSDGGSGGSGGGGGGGGIAISNPTPPKAEEPEYVKETEKKNFDDMSEAPWAEKAVNWLYEYGVVAGTDLGKFEPNRAITRAEALKIVLVGFGLASRAREDLVEINFTDVNRDDWYYFYVASAVAHGVAYGYDDNTFKPNALISREELATIIYRASLKGKVQYQQVDMAKEMFNDQQSISEWSKDSVYVLAQHGIIMGNENGDFMPQDNSTRAQTAVMVYRILEKITNTDYLDTDSR